MKIGPIPPSKDVSDVQRPEEQNTSKKISAALALSLDELLRSIQTSDTVVHPKKTHKT